MMLSVVDAVYLGNYKISLSFNDKSAGVADLYEVIFNDNRVPFLALRNESAFERFKIEHDTIVWESGLDLAPEFLFFMAFKGCSEFENQFKAWGYL
jgi:hypothetical protein